MRHSVSALEMDSGLPSLQDRNVLVTGASGFIGKYLTKTLAMQGARISILVRGKTDFEFNVESYIGDLQDTSFVNHCAEQSQPDIIFHLAAFKERSSKLDSFPQAISTNLLGSLNLFTAAQKIKGLSSFVILGTAEEYGRNSCPFVEDIRESPINAYSFSKLCVTQLCKILHTLYKIPFVILRPTLAYGPGQGTDMLLPALITSLIRNEHFPITPGQQTRDFVYVTDLVKAIMLAATKRKAVGEIINIGSGSSVSIGELSLMIQKIIGKSGLIDVGALSYRLGEVMEYSVKTDKAKEILEWTPQMSLEEGLAKTIKYYQELSS